MPNSLVRWSASNFPRMIRYRLAEVSELDDLKSFLFEHATNPWNYLPTGGVDSEFSLVAQQQASALVAVEGNKPVGFVIFYHPTILPSKYHQYTNGNNAIYIAEAAVHRNYGGQGIGTHLLTLVIERAPALAHRCWLLIGMSRMLRLLVWWEKPVLLSYARSLMSRAVIMAVKKPQFLAWRWALWVSY